MIDKLTDTKIDGWASLMRTRQYLLDQVEADLKQAGQPPLGWYDVLLELKRAPQGRLRLNEIGTRMLLEKSNLTRLVDRLEREAYVIREACNEDKRGAYAVITPAGRELQKRIWPIYAESIETHFASRLTQEEVINLLGLLRKLDPQLPAGSAAD
jgi:DNA-binding MarR family transcriptional regulator